LPTALPLASSSQWAGPKIIELLKLMKEKLRKSNRESKLGFAISKKTCQIIIKTGVKQISKVCIY
jgi:hypothetical protein